MLFVVYLGHDNKCGLYLYLNNIFFLIFVAEKGCWSSPAHVYWIHGHNRYLGTQRGRPSSVSWLTYFICATTCITVIFINFLYLYIILKNWDDKACVVDHYNTFEEGAEYILSWVSFFSVFVYIFLLFCKPKGSVSQAVFFLERYNVSNANDNLLNDVAGTSRRFLLRWWSHWLRLITKAEVFTPSLLNEPF